MQFECPNCGFIREVVKQKYYGRKIKCPQCTTSTRLGGEPSDEVVDGAMADSDNGAFDDAVIEAIVPLSSKATAVQGSPFRILDFTVNRGTMGTSVAYPCPSCNQKLTSSLNDAGGTDHCPDCHFVFVVPGEKEYEDEAAARAAEEKIRKARMEERTEASKKAVVNRVAQKALKNQNVQLDRDPLKEWLIYLVVIGALLGFATGKYIVSAVRYDESYLCIVILVLFLLGLIVNFRGILNLRNEYVCAAVCMLNLKKMDGIRVVKQEPVAGILHQHVIDLSHIAQYDQNVSQDSLVTLLYSRMMAKARMVDILSGVLVTIGLIGTVVGLISMTDGLSQTLASLDGDQGATDLLTGMRSTMSGLGTAFYTTLIGAILGSVVLRILNNVYTSNVDHLVTYVASTAEVSIVPRLKQQSRAKVTG